MPPPEKWCRQGSEGMYYYCIVKHCRAPNKGRKGIGLARKHARNHIKPVLCPERGNPAVLCKIRTAEQNDMKRHVQGYHHRWAERHGMPSEHHECRLCGQQILNRPDNLKRHKEKTCPAISGAA
jgi:hypothetical protein